ncbi:hypothetical protein [Azospirillum palustre]
MACAIAVSLAQHGEAGGSIYNVDVPDEEFFVLISAGMSEHKVILG